ncbi:hypothetical protein BH20GEM1_BH20GEM1_04880 [soil metagenome]
MLYVVGTAARLYLADPQQLAPLTGMPLALLPTYFVPLILLAHLRIFGWLVESGHPRSGERVGARKGSYGVPGRKRSSWFSVSPPEAGAFI